jgi:hypothetical protein
VSEYSEPWECGFEHESMCQIWHNGKTIFRIESSRLVGEECPGKYGERIVACVNYCAGLPTEFLENHAKVREKVMSTIVDKKEPTVGPLGDIAREILALDGDE